jgi:hypothetical protein
VAYLLKTITVEQEKKPLLANGTETIFVSKQGQRVSCEEGRQLGATIKTGLAHGSRGRATVRRRYKETSSEDRAGCKGLIVCASDLLSVWKLAMAL